METIAAIVLAALAFSGPSDANQGPSSLACATVDKGGYSVFADPTCLRAAYAADGVDFDSEEGVEDPSEETAD